MIDRIKNQEVLVVGIARSGMAAVELLQRAGAAKIMVTDSKKTGDLQEELECLRRYPSVEVVTGGNPPGLIKNSTSLVVKSPGVPPSLVLFDEARKHGVPVISEIELAYTFLKAPLIGVTGTNGKTTTTALIAAIMKEARFEPVAAAGNIGSPLSGMVDKINARGYIIAELSSFQLEDIAHFRPNIGLFLNFAADHLDYHGTIEKYWQAKVRIFENQKSSDYAVLNAADEKITALQHQCPGKVIWFGPQPVSVGVGLEDGWVTAYNPGTQPQKICPRDQISLPGAHNLENALAAAAAAWAAGADPGAIDRTLRSFRAIEHRLEHVAALGGVDYINDSKGTNPGATIKALTSFPGRKKILIAGGKDKGADFTELAAVIHREARFLVLLGETRVKLADAVKAIGFNSYLEVETLKEAVEAAAGKAEKGDVVLLSPACASWDMFSDYEARGKLFKELVRNLLQKFREKGDTADG